MRIRLLLTSLIAITLLGCAAYKHGYHSSRANHRYWLVDPEAQNFGFKYLTYIEGFRAPIKGFIKDRGIPDFIYPYQEGKREGVILYYPEENKAYDFFEANWNPSSVYPRAMRDITPAERAIFDDLLQKANKPVPETKANRA